MLFAVQHCSMAVRCWPCSPLCCCPAPLRWVVLAAVLGFHYPSLFLWFNNTYVTWSLVFCMAAMGLTLTFEEISSVFTRSPQLLLLGERVQGVGNTLSCVYPVMQP